MRFVWLPLWMCALVAGGFGCGDEDRRVPFGQTPPDEVEAPDPPPSEQPFEPAEGQSLPAGTMGVRVEGAVVAEGAEVRALLPLDLDDDGDRDVIAVRHDPNTEVLGVWAGTRDRMQFTSRLLGSTQVTGCTVGEASLRTLSPYALQATAEVVCPDVVDGPTSWTGVWIVSRERRPRLREAIATRGGVRADVEVGDLDDDHHEDLQVTIHVGEVAVPIRWMDRPGGLSRDRAEPTATFERAPEARAALVAALCGPSANVRIGTARWGLECPEALVRDAMVAGLDALLAEGELVRALGEIVAGAQASPEAIQAAAAPGVTMRPWYTGTFPPDDPNVRHTALAFDGEDLLVHVGGATLRVMPTGEQSVAENARPPIRDPGGTTYVAQVRRRCERGEAILRAIRTGGGNTPLQLGSIRIVEGALTCQETADDDGAWRVLGWAPQGLLSAHLGARRVVPLTAEGEPAGDGVALAAGEPTPAPLLGGRVTSGGDVYIFETAEGVLRVDLDGAELWRPEGWADIEEVPRAAALSADGNTVAVLRGDIVYRLTK